MVGTLRAASENDKQNGRCTQRPYILEREQIRRSQNGKRKSAVSGYIIPPPPPYVVLAPVSGGESVTGVNHTQLCPPETGGEEGL